MTVFEMRLKRLGFATYDEYLASDHWKGFRVRYKAAGAPMVCAVCDKGPVQLHHHNYANLGNESVDDITPLCDVHHSGVHEWLEKSGGMVNATHSAVKSIRDMLNLPVSLAPARKATKSERRKIRLKKRGRPLSPKAEQAKKDLAAYRGSHAQSIMSFLTKPR